MEGSAKKKKNSCTRNGVLRMTSMYALIKNRSQPGPPVLPQAQKDGHHQPQQGGGERQLHGDPGALEQQGPRGKHGIELELVIHGEQSLFRSDASL